MAVLTLLPDDVNPTLDFAGRELESHLSLLPLESTAFLAGYPVTLNWEGTFSDADRYCFRFTEEGGQITGSSPRAVLLGVYAYLRQIGFRFLYPGNGGTQVPRLTQANQLYCEGMPHTASFRHRGVCIEGADSLENVLDFIDWLPKNGYNAFFVQFKKPDVFLERWYHHLFNPLLPAQPLSRADLDRMEEKITQAIALRGILDHRVGHGWTAEAIGFANTGWRSENQVIPEDIRPLIAMVNGKRQLFGGVPTNTNLCYANPEAQDRLISQVISYAREHPTADYLHFWLADEPNNLCECDACRKTTLADQYVDILNRLDQALTAESLTTKIVFLLYQELLYAPVKARIRNKARFSLMFAPISRTFEKSYPRDLGKTSIAPYTRNQFRLPDTVEENLAHYFRWKETFDGDSFFYDYPLGRAHYGDFGYMKIARVIYDDIHALKALGSNGYMSCQELRAMTPTGFPNYVMGLSLLDDTISYETMKQDYFSAMFGDGYEAVIEYLQQLSVLSDTDYFNGHGPRLQPEKQARFLQIAETARNFLRDMGDLPTGQPQTRKNWEFLRFHGRYCILLSSALAALCAGDAQAAADRWGEFCGYVRQQECKVQNRLDVYRVLEVGTKYTGFPSQA